MTFEEALAEVKSWYDPGVLHAPDAVLAQIATALQTARLGAEKVVAVYGGKLYLWPVETDVETMYMQTQRRMTREEAQASIGGLVRLWAGAKFQARFSSLD